MMLPFRKIHRTFRLAAVWILMGLTLSACKKNAAESSESTSDTKLAGNLSTLQMMHPRLLLTDTRLQELKALSLTDARLQNYVNDVLAQAEKDLVKAPIQHVLIGPRLLDKSRECLLRVYDLSFAYRWTGNEKYLNGALSNLKTVCAFADWNPSHFLDVAEMSHAVAIGYDWLFNKMDTNTRQLIHSSLINLGLNEGKSAYAANAWWFNSEYNWNQVCNGGLTIGALAVADTDPLLATTILNKAVAGLPYALKSYGPDGVWCEGPGYWGYATEYTCYLLSALKTALGNTFGLTTATGMNLTGYFPIYASGPTGYMLNYADAGEKSKIGAPHPEMFLASLYGNNQFSDFLHDQLTTVNANVYDLTWYQPYANTAAKRELDKYFNGSVSLYFSRSSWSDPAALWIGIKAGYNTVNHGHLDLGNFEMDAMGQRWARDLGSDDYDLPDYFSGSTQSSPRWSYYRLNSLSHNVPVLGGVSQNVAATAKFTKHAEGVAEPFAVLDLTQAYQQFASSVQRGMKVMNNRQSVLVQDEFVLSKTTDIAWGMTTDATIQVLGSRQAELTLGGKKMTAQILAPDNGRLTIESAQELAPQKTNAGVNRLMVRLPGMSGNVSVAIRLYPQWNGTPPTLDEGITPLSKW